MSDFEKLLKRIKQCDGNCDKHHGEVLRVRVMSSAHDWGVFNYCEEARRIDSNNGLTVTIIKENEG